MLRKDFLTENFIDELRALLQRTVCAGEAKAHSDYPKVLCFHTEPFFIVEEERPYGTRVALIGIIVGNRNESTKLNEILHEYGQYVVGRMGVPYKDKDINVISIIVDAPQDVISACRAKSA